MNRKVLLGIFIVLLIFIGVGHFAFFKSKKNTTQTSEDFASTSNQPPKQKSTNAKSEVREESVSEASASRMPNQAEVAKSGKYAFQNLKPKSSIQEESAKRDKYLAQNRTGVVIDSADQKFVLMKLRAAKEKTNDDTKRSLDHELFPIDQQVAQKVLVDDQSYPVVYSESNGKIGLLTGVLLIQTNENSEAEKLALNYPMDLQIFDPSIGLASYKVKSGEGLYDIYNRIKTTERIKSITVEVLDSYKGY